jgi:hypothetical protein
MIKYIKYISLIGVAILGLFATGCAKRIPPSVFVTVESNETLFVVPLNGENKDAQVKFDSAEYVKFQKIGVREWKKRWYLYRSGHILDRGEWREADRVIKVNRKPINISFKVDDESKAKHDPDAMWFESADSVGFSLGFDVSARIEEDDTATYLYNYQEKDLETTVRQEVKNRIAACAQDFCSTMVLDSLRLKKVELIDSIRKDVIPYFKVRGVTITTIAQTGGFVYENPNIQSRIDEVFIAQQDKEIAKAQLAAQNDKNLKSKSATEQEKQNQIVLAQASAEAVRLQAEAVAAGNFLKQKAEAEGVLLVRETEAKGIRLVNDALKEATSSGAYLANKELDVRLEWNKHWSGNFPSTITAVGDKASGGMNLFLGMPNGTTPVPVTK